MSTTKTKTDQCQALVEDGERCSRPAQDDGFCYQHDESDPTVDDAGEEDTEQEQDDGSEAETDDESTSDSAVDTDGSVEMEDEAADDQAESGESERDESSAQGSALMDVRNTAEVIGRDVIGCESDGIIGITRTDDGWQVTLEVVERSAVPDTQDILGRYEIEMDSDYNPTGYHRIDRYRRGDTTRDELLE